MIAASEYMGAICYCSLTFSLRVEQYSPPLPPPQLVKFSGVLWRACFADYDNTVHSISLSISVFLPLSNPSDHINVTLNFFFLYSYDPQDTPSNSLIRLYPVGIGNTPDVKSAIHNMFTWGLFPYFGTSIVFKIIYL